jgi:hypothetical protein
MANTTAMTPYAQVVGAADVYLAVYGTAKPALNTTPGSSWTLMGPTTGDQSIEFSGGLTYFSDNDHQGNVKAVRPEEDVAITFTLATSTLEQVSRIMHNVGNLATGTSPVNYTEMGFKRGAIPTEYALLIRGAVDSPYGQFPAQDYIPRCVSDAEPTKTRAKDGRVEWECKFMALEDDNQVDGKRLGWGEAQTS